MTSFQITLTPHRRTAVRFIGSVRRAIQKALADARSMKGISQSDIAREIGVHRSVINREIIGHKDMTLGRVAEIASTLGLEPHFELREPIGDWMANTPPQMSPDTATKEIVFDQQPILVTRKAAA